MKLSKGQLRAAKALLEDEYSYSSNSLGIAMVRDCNRLRVVTNSTVGEQFSFGGAIAHVVGISAMDWSDMSMEDGSWIEKQQDRHHVLKQDFDAEGRDAAHHAATLALFDILIEEAPEDEAVNVGRVESSAGADSGAW